MTTFDYAPLEARAVALVKRFGQPVVVRRRTASAGHTPTFTTIDTAATAAVLRVDASEIDGTLIRATDKRLIVSGLVDVDVADRVVIGGEVHEVVNVRTVSPGGTVIYRDVFVRAV